MSFEGPIASGTAFSALALARCSWLDAFADLELEISYCTARVHGEPGKKNRPLILRLKKLSELQPEPGLSASDDKLVKDLAAQCLALLPMRAAIVHSSMRVCAGSPALAAFRNVADVASGQRNALVFSAADLEAERLKLVRLAKGFRRVAVKSPPAQPSGGAS